MIVMTCGYCGICTKCRIAINDARYRAPMGITLDIVKRWQTEGKYTPSRGGVHPTLPPPPYGSTPQPSGHLHAPVDYNGVCVHRGDLIPAQDAPDTARAWYECDNRQAPLGKSVCACRGCGNHCPGYTPPNDVDGQFIDFDMLRVDYRLKPKKLCAVVTVAAGQKAQDLLEYSRPTFQDYAHKVDADYVELSTEFPRFPIGAKFQLTKILEYYDRVFYVDADVLIGPEVPNIFERVPYDTIGGYDDWKPTSVVYPEFHKEYEDFRLRAGLDKIKVPYYLNTGVMAFSRAHHQVFTVPHVPLREQHCAEQHWWIARMHDRQVKVKELDKKWNYQYWVHENPQWQTRKEWEGRFDPSADCVIHFSGMDWHKAPAENHAERLRWMKRFYEKFFRRGLTLH